MSSAVQNILSQIDRLDEADQAELRAALTERARAGWKKLADTERKRSEIEGLTEEDIQRAVDDVRYGGKGP